MVSVQVWGGWLLGRVRPKDLPEGADVLDIVPRGDLQELMAVESLSCVSFYLSTHASGPAVAEGPLRLKNMTAEATRELERLGLRSSEAAELLGPVEALIDDTEFWTHAEAGLAAFVDSDGLRRFRLPSPVEDAAVWVSDRFWIAPLLASVEPLAGFFVLALSENEVRLLRCGRYRVAELGLGEIPASSAEALRFDDRESQLQSHGADRVGSGHVSATFHGQGVSSDFDDVDQTRFLQSVDRGLSEIVGDGSDPLVLAGVEEIVSRFRSLSSHRNIADSSIRGNPEQLSPKDLHEKALPMVATHLTADQIEAHDSFGSSSATTDDSVADAVAAATSGRVDRLFIVNGRRVWGSVDPDNRQIEEHSDRRPGDVDLVDVAARVTLENGGEVFAVDAAEMPADGSLAAVLRY